MARPHRKLWNYFSHDAAAFLSKYWFPLFHSNIIIPSYHMSDAPKSKQIIPSELRLSYKWDTAIENLVVKTAVGTLIAGLASLVLFSK